jgi:hypothetical protein
VVERPDGDDRGQPLLALRVASEGSRAIRDSPVLECGIGVGGRAMPVSAAKRAIGLPDVVVARSARQLFVNQLVDFRHEAIKRIGYRHTFVHAGDHDGASMAQVGPTRATSLVKRLFGLGRLTKHRSEGLRLTDVVNPSVVYVERSGTFDRQLRRLGADLDCCDNARGGCHDGSGAEGDHWLAFLLA